MFDYDELCQRTLGSSDFLGILIIFLKNILAIARNFENVIVKNVPVINTFDRNSTRRFILLVNKNILD